jgi:hypothetical protein
MSDVRGFGAKGDGTTDDAEAIRHALAQGDGELLFPPGTYLIGGTIKVDLAKLRRFSARGAGGVPKLLMAGPGFAFEVVGTHGKTAAPGDFADGVWQRERMPTFADLEIEGRHPDAEGILFQRTMQATLSGVLLRRLGDAVRLVERNRNLLVTGCHIYDNRRHGILIYRCNIHQAIVTGSHVSYNRRAGIHILGGEVRNVQIVGNDIEYNFEAGYPEPAADIVFDASPPGSSIREGTISGNTVQARYSQGGANIRIVGTDAKANRKAGMIAITGNLIGSQEVNVHLSACRAVTLEGNVLYSGHRLNLLVEDSKNVVIGANSFDHNPDYEPSELVTGIRIARSESVIMSACPIHDASGGKSTVKGAVQFPRRALVDVEDCRAVTIQGCQIMDGAPVGLHLQNCSDVVVSGCTVGTVQAARKPERSVLWKGAGSGNLLTGCRLASPFEIEAAANVVASGNV